MASLEKDNRGCKLMNKEKFRQALIDTLEEMGLDAYKQKYKIYPVIEKGKKYNSKDDFVRLLVFPPDRISKLQLDFEDAITRFSIFEPCYPLWIDVSVGDNNIVELYTSLRFRRPSELQRKETGHEPFKLVNSSEK